MTAQRAARFVLAPVVDGVVVWSAAADVVLAPVRLPRPVRVTLLVGAR